MGNCFNTQVEASFVVGPFLCFNLDVNIAFLQYVTGLALQYLHGFVYKPPVVLGIVGPMHSNLYVEMNEVASSYAINQVGLVLCCKCTVNQNEQFQASFFGLVFVFMFVCMLAVKHCP